MTALNVKAPRSGGRTAAHYPVEGTAALAPQPLPDQSTDRRELRVAPPPPVLTPRAPFVLLVLVLVIGGVLGILMLNTKINENAFRLADLHRQQQQLDLQEQQLAQDLAGQSSSGSLEAAARRLGLVPSGKPAYLRLPDGRVFEVPQPATGQPSLTSQTATGGR
jgi:hypothetical protein